MSRGRGLWDGGGSGEAGLDGSREDLWEGSWVG